MKCKITEISQYMQIYCIFLSFFFDFVVSVNYI